MQFCAPAEIVAVKLGKCVFELFEGLRVIPALEVYTAFVQLVLVFTQG